jgi:hypothetical protein
MSREYAEAPAMITAVLLAQFLEFYHNLNVPFHAQHRRKEEYKRPEKFGEPCVKCPPWDKSKPRILSPGFKQAKKTAVLA